jgi:hypothetical protein
MDILMMEQIILSLKNAIHLVQIVSMMQIIAQAALVQLSF